MWRGLCRPLAVAILALTWTAPVALAAEEPPGEEIVIEEDDASDTLMIEEDGASDTIVVDDPASAGEGEVIELEDDGPETGTALAEAEESAPDEAARRSLVAKVERLWIEYGYFPDSDAPAGQQGYLHGRFSLATALAPAWELKATLRADGYHQWDGVDASHGKLDYGESYIRYRGDTTRITVGAQAVIWGRIDEIPPSDRMSTVDLSRFVLDDLEDRRRASPVIRLEQFIGDAKLDLVYLPWFREAELPDRDSVWYPVRQADGQIMGLKTTPAMAALIRNARFTTEAPDGDGGFGARYTASAGALDYGLTISRTRQSTPYFRYDPARNLFEAVYPRSWSVAGDLGLEAWGATWRLEAAWFSDTPVTRLVEGYDLVRSLAWGGGVEFYPGDGDTRVNLQLTGTNLLDAGDVVDRTDVYSFNGSFEMPFAHEQWRLGMRVYVGLGENDVYLNPQLTWLGWEPVELYLQGHYFQGGEGTPGGYHENDSLLTLGLRARF